MSIVIADVTPRIQYTAAAGDVDFIIPFPFYTDTDIVAYQRAAGSSPDDTADILVYATDYTLVGAGVATGGTLTLVAGATVGDIVTIIRDQPESRSNLYTSGGAFTADAVNADFSRNVLMNQQNEMVATEIQPRYDYNAVITASDLIMDQLPAGYSWRKNAGGTRIEAFVATDAGTPVSQSYLSMDVNQAAHGLVLGNVVRVDALGDYVTAQADSAANAEVLGYVSAVTDVDNFTLQLGGAITTGLAGLTTGSVYYLSPTVAGAITAVKPTTAGQVVKPVLCATGAAAGIWLNYLGIVLS